MNLRRISSLAGDLLQVNRAFLTSGARRSHLREAVKVDGFDRRRDALIREDERAAPAAAVPYARLAETSLTLAGIRTKPMRDRTVNLVIGEVRSSGIFAGVHTAVTLSARLATALGAGLRIVMLDPTSTDNSRAGATAAARRIVGDDLRLDIVPREGIRAAEYGTDDVWVATHYKTAHAVQVACEVGAISSERVVYLIQDYEPGFVAWSTESVLAEATYRAGFLPVVNSMPLWEYLTGEAGLDIPRDLVFAPAFEEERLREAAAARRRTPTARVLFYGRRSKHRNLFELGVSAIKAAALELGDDVRRTEFVSLGEPHDDIPLPGGAMLTSRGRLAWEGYFAFLPTVDVALSLQQSPHPSHPPFDAAISGGLAVTNDFAGTRGELHPRITAAPADTASLAAALITAIQSSWDAEPGEFRPVAAGSLGGGLDQVVSVVVERLAGRLSAA